MSVKLLSSVFIVFFLLFLKVDSVLACTCSSPPSFINEDSVDKIIEQSDAVFVGRMVVSEVASDGSYEFEVLEGFKGVDDKLVKVHSGWGTCGYPFYEGKTYLVFASEQENYYSTSLCSNTREISDSNRSELEVLRGNKQVRYHYRELLVLLFILVIGLLVFSAYKRKSEGKENATSK